MNRRTGGNVAERVVLITGGAGFVGSNLAHRLANDGRRVLIYDNLSRPGVERNLAWLRATHGERIRVLIEDIRSPAPLSKAVKQAAEVFHFAAQVAVTTSLTDPVHDFTVNARGTLNVLEAIRTCQNPPGLVYTSTNKVYGALEDVALVRTPTRYSPTVGSRWAEGIDETRPLDFCSPYGCSKGVADQYVIDYARSYGIPALVLRMSCIYGPRQVGTEEQGWVAHFVRRTLVGEPINVYGDGLQVRDLLYIDDLVEALVLAQLRMPQLRGHVFNIGGGPTHTTSLLELLSVIAALDRRHPTVVYGPRRVGDQRHYVSDHRKFSRVTSWWPKVTVAAGVARLHRWFVEYDDRKEIPA